MQQKKTKKVVERGRVVNKKAVRKMMDDLANQTRSVSSELAERLKNRDKE